MSVTVILGTIVAVIAIVAVIFLMMGYVKAPPDRAFIISGLRKEPKILIGRAGIKIPFFERKDVLLIKQISVDIKTNGYIPTADFIGVDIDAVAKIQVDTGKEGMALAMRNFLNMDEKAICSAITDSLQGNMREIVGTITLKDISTDRKKFGDAVQDKAQIDMQALGIKIISCNIQNVQDEKGCINDLGQDNLSKIKKDASIAKAQADRDVAKAQAEAAREANDAKIASELAIEQKNNELEIKKAELKKAADIKKAESDAAYRIQEETQRRTIEVTTAEADLAKQEMEIKVKQKAAEVREQQLVSEINKQADADMYKQQRAAEAEAYKKKQAAEAELYQKGKQATALKIQAEADATAINLKAEADARAIRLKGQAEAEVIKQKALAEAEGIDKKAEAMAKMGEAAILEMYFKALPEAVKNASEPLAKVDKITMYGSGNSTKLTGDIINTVTNVTNGIKESTGLDLDTIINKFTDKGLTALANKLNPQPNTPTEPASK